MIKIRILMTIRLVNEHYFLTDIFKLAILRSIIMVFQSFLKKVV